MKQVSCAFLLAVLFPAALLAQGGYYINPGTVTLPDTTVSTETTSLPIPVNREDVKAIGMGKTQVAGGKTFNAMMYNPALLAHGKLSIEAATVEVSLPPTTYDALRYLSDHKSDFKQAFSLKEIWAGANDLQTAYNANNLQGMTAALQRIQDGMRFPHDLLEQVVGNSNSPKTHGILIVPAITAQVGRFGFSLYGTAQTAFQVQQSPVIDALLQIKIPTDPNDPAQIVDAITSLQGTLNALVDANGNINPDVLPVAYAVSYIDIVGAAGYAMPVTRELSLGANLKVINRRFTTKRIVADAYDKMLSEARSGFEKNVTGVTLDIGGLYQFPSGTVVGASLQNIIPVPKISSIVSASFPVSGYDYERDAFGNPVVNAQGDTVLNNVERTVNVNVPFDLKVPVILNFGVRHPITPNWDVAFDWPDVAAQDVRYPKDNYLQRMRLGTEYRLEVTPEVLGVTPRIGMAEGRVTLGFGINLFRVVQLDGAYAYDNYVGDYSYFAQVRLGW